jgi:hypothetical protein
VNPIQRLEARKILTDCALRFDGFKYLEETDLDTNLAIDELLEEIPCDWDDLKKLGVFFSLQRALCKWALVYEPYNGKYWRIFHEMFFDIISIEIVEEYQLENRYLEWQEQYGSRLEAVIQCVRNNHKSTPWDDAAKPDFPKASEQLSSSTDTNPAVHTPMLIDFEDGIQASLQEFACRKPYAGMLEGRPGKRLNDEILTDLEEDEWYVIDPVFDKTDPNWPELPRYQITCSFHSNQQLGPQSELGSDLKLVFFTDDIDSQPMPLLIQKFVAEFGLSWYEHATPRDLP